jgi:hypothetical protein
VTGENRTAQLSPGGRGGPLSNLRGEKRSTEEKYTVKDRNRQEHDDKLSPAERAYFEAERARRPQSPEGWFDHHQRVDFQDPIAQIVAKMVEELEKHPDWRHWKLSIFRDFETRYKKRGKYKGDPTDSSATCNAHYNALFAVALQAFKEGYRMARDGQHLGVVLEAEMIAQGVWPEERESTRRRDDDSDWWWKGHRPWGYI